MITIQMVSLLKSDHLCILSKYNVEVTKHNGFFIRSGKVKLPEWVDLVKTNVAKELAPYDEDW